MAARTARIGLICALAAVVPLAAQPARTLTLEQAGQREPREFRPLYAGQSVRVSGAVSAAAIRIGSYTHLPMQDQNGHGFTLEGPYELLAPYGPGDRIEAEGVIGMRAGLPVLERPVIRRTGRQQPPAPRRVGLQEAASHAVAGSLITVEGDVVAPGENAGGEVIVLGPDGRRLLQVFLPRQHYSGSIAFEALRGGDRVRVTGIAGQYAPSPPYNRGYQILVASPQAVQLLERSWFISPRWLLILFAALGVGATVWLRRERALARQRRSLRGIMAIAEEVVQASTPADIASIVQSHLPVALRLAEVELYLLNRANNTLEPLRDSGPEGSRLSVNSPIGGLSSAIALSFRNRAMLAIPDTGHSPLFQKGQPDLPASVVLVPMLSRGEVSGVLSITFKQRREISKDEQAVIQHLGNQVAMALRLQEQNVMREQLLRTEKMAAANGIEPERLAELRQPIEAIRALAAEVNGVASVLITRQAEEAGEALKRLAGGTAGSRTTRVDLTELVRSAVEAVKAAGETSGITLEVSLPPRPASIDCDPAELGNVLEALLTGASHATAGQPERRLAVKAGEDEASVTVAVEFTGPAQTAAAELGKGMALQQCQAIVESFEGEFQLRSVNATTFRFEMEFPRVDLADADPEPERQTPRPARMLTALVVEPDLAAQRRIMGMLSERGHRSIPVATAEEGVDLSHRLRFDVAVCSATLPGMNWVEFHAKVKRSTPAFVLLSDAFDAALARSFRPGEGFIVTRTAFQEELIRVLAALDAAHPAMAR